MAYRSHSTFWGDFRYYERPDWMSELYDHAPMDALSIPGSHDTMGRGQDLPISEQYLMGVRFVDIWCRWHPTDALRIRHNRWLHHSYFITEVLDPTVKFLQDNPSETILMLVQFERDYTSKTGVSYSDLLQHSLRNAGASWLNEVPDTLGEARGHIILLYRRDRRWPDVAPVVSTAIDDYFHVHYSKYQHEPGRRWAMVMRHLEEAYKGRKPKPFVTFVSGYKEGWFGFKLIKPMADFLHRQLEDYLRPHSYSRLGVVLTDFVPDSIVSAVIDSNMRTWDRLWRQVLSYRLWAILYLFAHVMTSSDGNIFRVTGLCAGISPVTGDFPAQSQWRGALVFSLICARIYGWRNNREAGDLRRHHPHYDVAVMQQELK